MERRAIISGSFVFGGSLNRRHGNCGYCGILQHLGRILFLLC